MTAIVDYDAGNLRSVETAVSHLGAEYFVTSNPDDLSKADRLIFPGVGEAVSAMQNLADRKLDTGIKSFIASGKPVLGICIGFQILFERSQERDAVCLGVVPGEVVKFASVPGRKIPHMGWNQVRPSVKHPVFENIPEDASFYFVHSYYPEPGNKESVLCTSDYDQIFTSGIVQDNLLAVQFHPEKSGPHGLTFLKNFLSWSPANA